MLCPHVPCTRVAFTLCLSLSSDCYAVLTINTLASLALLYAGCNAVFPINIASGQMPQGICAVRADQWKCYVADPAQRTCFEVGRSTRGWAVGHQCVERFCHPPTPIHISGYALMWTHTQARIHTHSLLHPVQESIDPATGDGCTGRGLDVFSSSLACCESLSKSGVIIPDEDKVCACVSVPWPGLLNLTHDARPTC
jgi:hypothetical protein